MGRLDPETGDIKLFTPNGPPGQQPYALRFLSDGVRPWFSYWGSNKIATIDPVTFELKEYVQPDPRTRIRRMGVTSDDMLWYGDWGTGKLARFNPKTGAGHRVGRTERSAVAALRNDGDRRQDLVRRVRTRGPNNLVRFDPKTEKFQTLPIPGGGGIVRHMMPTPDGKIAMAMSGLNTVGHRRDPAEFVQLTAPGTNGRASSQGRQPSRPSHVADETGDVGFYEACAERVPRCSFMRGARAPEPSPGAPTSTGGQPQQAGAQRMKQLSGPVAAAAIAAALITFTAPADARTPQHGGASIPYIGSMRHLGSIPYLGSLRHGSIPNLGALRRGSIPNLGSLRNGSIPHLGSLRRLGSLRDLGSIRDLGSLGSIGSLGSLGSLGGLGGIQPVVRRRRPRSRRCLRLIGATREPRPPARATTSNVCLALSPHAGRGEGHPALPEGGEGSRHLDRRPDGATQSGGISVPAQAEPHARARDGEGDAAVAAGAGPGAARGEGDQRFFGTRKTVYVRPTAPGAGAAAARCRRCSTRCARRRPTPARWPTS